MAGHEIGRHFMLLFMRSERDGITFEWLVPSDTDEAIAESALREWFKQRAGLGPLPRIELPETHPDKHDYVYDESSTFRYVDLLVGSGGGDPDVETHYGKDLAGSPGGGGPSRPWSEFMAALLDEMNSRWSSPE